MDACAYIYIVRGESVGRFRRRQTQDSRLLANPLIRRRSHGWFLSRLRGRLEGFKAELSKWISLQERLIDTTLTNERRFCQKVLFLAGKE